MVIWRLAGRLANEQWAKSERQVNLCRREFTWPSVD